MRSPTLSAAPEILLFWAFLAAPAASPQMPARPGYLHLTSKPTGEKIMINHQPRPELTEVTLVVSPGTYAVQIGDCAEQSSVEVSSGLTREVHCP
jgi:hypothetical protein